jgi:hypothetical protein
MQDTDKPREVRTDETLVFGEPFEGERRGFEHGVIRDTLMRADEGSERLRDGEGEEEVRSRELLLQVVAEPLLGFMMLTLRAMTMATRMMDAVLTPTAWALRETVSIVATWAVLDGADDLAVRGGEGRIALKVCWSKGVEDIAEGGHGRSPCMREVMRS